MIALCDEYLAVRRRYSAGEGPDEGPLFRQIERMERILDRWEPSTWAGLACAAHVAAFVAGAHRGASAWMEGDVTDWTKKVTEAVLRLARGGLAGPAEDAA